MKKLIILFSIINSCIASAQLPNGSIAPNFTMLDYNGNLHVLYDYLNADKTVFIEIFAAHCPTCWAYHQTNTLKDLYQNYGPNGTDEVMVLALEHDQYNGHDAFIGVGDPWVTQGNWLEGTPYPIFNVEQGDRAVFDDYNVSFYPLIFKICPDKTLERVMTSESVPQLYEKVQECQKGLSIEQGMEQGSLRIDHIGKRLILEGYQKMNGITITDMQGQTVMNVNSLGNASIDLSSLTSGIYLFGVRTENGTVNKKLLLQ